MPGRVVKAADLKSRSRGCKSEVVSVSLKLFLGRLKLNSSAMFVNSQLVCLPTVGIFKSITLS